MRQAGRCASSSLVRSALFALGLCCILPAPAGGQGAELPQDYRNAPYKAPTPDSVPGGTTLFFAEDVEALIGARDPVLVNVTPITLSPPDAGGKRQWIPRRDHAGLQIEGSHWLPNTGLHRLDDGMTAYFRDNLERLTDGRKDRALLFYCTADCWMSWNAAKRAAKEYGYSAVFWYPAGIDGWKGDGRPLVEAVPVPFTPGARPAE